MVDWRFDEENASSFAAGMFLRKFSNCFLDIVMLGFGDQKAAPGVAHSGTKGAREFDLMCYS
jgi:hypothetical protein